MKIFRVDRNITDWPAEADRALNDPVSAPPCLLPVRLLADSAAERNNRPVFLPDFAREGWIVEVRPAVTISRLGKFIAPQFAGRYVGAITLCATLRPSALAAANALTDSFDGALVCGLPLPGFYPKDDSAGDIAAGTSITIDATLTALPSPRRQNPSQDAHRASPSPVSVSFTFSPADLRIPETIALLSRYTTLKSGDLILPASLPLRFPALINHELTACATSEPVHSSASMAASFGTATPSASPLLRLRLK